MTEVTALTMTADDARRLTERIRLTAHTFAESRAKLIELVEEAKSGNAHEALGYASWTAYLSDVLGDEPLRLARDDRKELVGILAAEGMSTRAIAPIVGSSDITVRRDLASATNVAVERPVTVTSLDGRERPATRPDVIRVDPETGEILDTPRPSMNTKVYPARDTERAMERAIPALLGITGAMAEITPEQISAVNEETRAEWARDLKHAIERLHSVNRIVRKGISQ